MTLLCLSRCSLNWPFNNLTLPKHTRHSSSDQGHRKVRNFQETEFWPKCCCRDRTRLVISWKRDKSDFIFHFFFRFFSRVIKGVRTRLWRDPAAVRVCLCDHHRMWPHHCCPPQKQLFIIYFLLSSVPSFPACYFRLLHCWATCWLCCVCCSSFNGPAALFPWRLLPKVTVVTWFLSFSFTTVFCCYYSLLHGCDATLDGRRRTRHEKKCISGGNQFAPDSCQLNNFLVM